MIDDLHDTVTPSQIKQFRFADSDQSIGNWINRPLYLSTSTSNPHRRNRDLGERPQRQSRYCKLALHNVKRPRQTQAPLPFKLIESGD